MKILLLFICLSITLLLHAQVAKTVENRAGNLSTLLTDTERGTVTNLTINGTINANDVAIINKGMPALTGLDISNTTIIACNIPAVDTFMANWFPGPSISRNSFDYGGLNKPLLTSVILPPTLEVLGSGAFDGCSALTSITLPSTVTAIGWSAFARCTSLQSITIPASVTHLDEWVFDGCSSLGDVAIEASLTIIPVGAFANCSALTSINLPSTVESIQMSAFSNCSSLTTLTLPASVSNIGNIAFYSCTNLSTIYSYNPVPPQTSSSFANVDKANCSVYVPLGSGDAYAAAEEWKDFNIVEDPGFGLSAHAVTLGAENNSSATVRTHCKCTWTTSSDKEWLTVMPASGSNNGTITFTAQDNPLYTPRTATATVSTNDGLSETVTVTQLAKANTAPVANAGVDQSAEEGTTIQLDGSASSDADSDALTYHWTAPDGITLSSTTDAKPTFTAPQVDANTAYTFSLVVNDGKDNSAEDQVVVTILNKIELSVSANAVTLGAENDLSANVDLYCNSSWNASSNHSWLSVSPTSGNNNQTITFTAQANPLFTSRTAIVTFSTTGGLSQTVTITQSAKNNTAPVANAGVNQSAEEGATIQLDGSASSDVDSDALTYHWTAPEGITLSSTTDAKPTFTAPQVNANTEYTFSLVVNDGKDNSAEDQIVVTVLNKIELSVSANAVTLGAENNLSANVDLQCNSAWNASSDQNWLTVNPLSGNNNQTISFTAEANPLFTSRTAIVTFSTTDGLSQTVTITQSAKGNTAPVANAGVDQTLDEGETAQLDGSASSDADSDALTYHWTAPNGIILSSTTDAKPTFTTPQVDANTEYTFSLVVNDGKDNSAEDQVVVTVLNKIELSVSANSVTLGAENNLSANVDLQCNSAWNASCDQNWLTVSLLSGNNNQTITFTAEANSLSTSRTAIVTFSTTGGLSETVTITQSAKGNTAPVANAGANQSFEKGQLIQLDGSASSDADGDELTYLWTPAQGITLSSTTAANPTFTAPQVDVATDYIFTLIVNDGKENSVADQVTITVTNNIIELSLSINNVTFENGASSARIILRGNAQWTVTSDQLWLTVSPASGTGEHILTINSQANTTILDRIATITVSAPGVKSCTLVVTQHGLPAGLEDEVAINTQLKYYPNPFTQTLTIEVANPTNIEVSADIFNMTGQRIKSLVRARNDEKISLTWNGTNELGQVVPYGLYILKVNGIGRQVVFGGR